MNNEKMFNIDDYFTKDLRDLMSEMTINEMNSSLLELENTRYWIALLKYIATRQSAADSVLKTADPNTNQTQIARTQGILIGLSDIVNAIVLLKMNSDRIDQEAENTRAQRLG